MNKLVKHSGVWSSYAQLAAALAHSGLSSDQASKYVRRLAELLPQPSVSPACSRLVVGLGAGRCGSTTLTRIVSGIRNACATHENPPLVTWPPTEAQRAVHFARFRLLLFHYQLVCDVAHWWLNMAEHVFAAFPTSLAIGLLRDEEACAKSFAAVKGNGPGSLNHWCAGGAWRASAWDASYPTYPVDPSDQRPPDEIRLDQITQYVSDYNAALRAMARTHAGRVMLVHTEDLSAPATQEQIFQFVGMPGQYCDAVLNAGTLEDGRHAFQL